MLAKDLKRRSPSIRSVGNDLEQLLEDLDTKRITIFNRSRPWFTLSSIALLTGWVLVASAIVFWLILSSRIDSPSGLYDPIPLTSYPGLEKQPTFSPDGSQFAFVWNGEKRDNIDIYVKAVGPGKPLRLTTDPLSDFSPAWSPDGSRIAFLRSRGGKHVELFLIPPTGGTESKFAELKGEGTFLTLAWSPDGKYLAFNERIGDMKSTGIILLSLETGEKKMLTSPSPEARDANPVFSFDGQTVFFLRSLTGDYLYSVPVTGGEPKEIRRVGEIESMSLAPDGKELILARGDQGELLRVPVSGGTMRRIIGLEGGDLAISHQGRRLAVAQQHQARAHIWKLDLKEVNDKSATPFIVSTRFDGNPSYARNGEKIVFSSGRSGKFDIWTCSQNGTDLLQLTTIGNCGSPRWSPDGNWIAFDHNVDGVYEIHVVGAAGGAIRRITDSKSADFLPHWSSDGRFIYFSSNRTGEFQVWKAPFEPRGENTVRPAIQVTKNGGFRPIESFDGKNLYYLKSREDQRIWSMSIDSGEEILVSESISLWWPNWDLALDGIYYIDWQQISNFYWSHLPLFTAGLKWRVRFYSFEDRSVVDLRELRYPPSAGPGFGISPDGRWLLSSQYDNEESDLMLVENFR
jgi:Tol biopolymer transport system component